MSGSSSAPPSRSPPGPEGRRSDGGVPIERALLAALVLALLIGFVPAGIALDRRLGTALEARARADLALAPRVLAARAAARSDALMMHAKELAHDSALAHALAGNDRPAAGRALGAAISRLPPAGALPLVLRAPGQPWTAAPWWTGAADTLVARTVTGAMPVAAVPDAAGAALHVVALAPVIEDGQWVGAAGYAVPVDSTEVAALAALTRSEVLVLGASDTSRAAGAAVSTLDPGTAAELRAAVRQWRARPPSAFDSVAVRTIAAGGRRWFVALGRLPGVAGTPDAGTMVFARAEDTELALLPALRRGVLVSGVAGLLGALIAGAVVARLVAGSVRGLACAADATAAGDFAARLPRSQLRELRQVSGAFAEMRHVLDLRLRQLETANAELAERSARLTALQAELSQRDRLAAAGRLVTQLAHEIRNPVASLRNCLELLRRRVAGDPEAVEFADLAIDELLRMHELAEQMLDLHRPHASATRRAPCVALAREVAAFTNLAPGPSVVVRGPPADGPATHAAIESDALKQVLLNLVQNARETMGAPGGASSAVAVLIETSGQTSGPTPVDETLADPGFVALTVLDGGPGIAEAVLPRIFDPFFTTKAAVRGVGLGLFVAEGLVRGAGGRLTAGNRPAPGEPAGARGAWFRVELPYAAAAPAGSTA